MRGVTALVICLGMSRTSLRSVSVRLFCLQQVLKGSLQSLVPLKYARKQEDKMHTDDAEPYRLQ
jgi:hypothetical protein